VLLLSLDVATHVMHTLLLDKEEQEEEAKEEEEDLCQ
jgi:hypothetical protein